MHGTQRRTRARITKVYAQGVVTQGHGTHGVVHKRLCDMSFLLTKDLRENRRGL